MTENKKKQALTTVLRHAGLFVKLEYNYKKK